MSLSARLLSFLVDQATRHRDRSASRSMRSATALKASQNTQDSLSEFADQKTGERRATVGQETTASALVGHARFSGKLKTAISLQAEQVSQSEAEFEATRVELADRQRELRALQLLEERQKRKTQQKLRRAEQRVQDELAARIGASPETGSSKQTNQG